METIIIATDFSEPANTAVSYGTSLAQYFGSNIVLVNACELPLVGYGPEPPASVLLQQEEDAARKLEDVKQRILEKIGYNKTISCYAASGPVISVLLEAVNKFDGQMVVMGITGRAGHLRKNFIGSNVLVAGRQLPVPVLVIPEVCSFQSIQKIVFAFDQDDSSDLLLSRLAAKITESFSAELELLHISRREDVASVSSEKLATFSENLRTTKQTSLVLRAEEIAATLSDYIASNDCDLVMLNPKKVGIFDLFFRESTSSKLVFSLRKPMLLL